MIRHALDLYMEPIPAVLEIPSKDHPYDASKDSILRRARVSTPTDMHVDSNIEIIPVISVNFRPIDQRRF